jgi:hypothetical protein
MAIRKNITHNTIEYQDAYIRIEKVEYGQRDLENNNTMNFHAWVMIYPDKPQEQEAPICSSNFHFVYDFSLADNLIKQSYESLKQLSDWSDSTDDI